MEDLGIVEVLDFLDPEALVQKEVDLHFKENQVPCRVIETNSEHQ